MLRQILFFFLPIILLGCQPVHTSEPLGQSLPATATPLPFPTATSEATLPLSVISTSPDYRWNALGITEWDVKEIVSQDGRTRWELENVPEEYGWFEWSYLLYRWSTQGDFAYLSLHPKIDGFLPFYQGTGLYRFDLSTGAITEIFSGREPNIAPFSLSPDEDLLAYAVRSNGSLFLRVKDLNLGVEKEMALPGYDDAGNMIWSPMQDRIVFSVSTGYDPTDWQVSMAVANLQNSSVTILYSDEKQALKPEEWLDNNEILVSSSGTSYVFSLGTNELRPYIKPTSTP